jgi:hypothetical protein
MANIVISDSFFNLVPREPLIVTRGKVKYLSFQPVLDGEKRDSKKKQKSALMDARGSALFNPYQLALWDYHRGLVRDYRKVKDSSDKEFNAWIIDLASCIGDLFTPYPPDLLMRGFIGTPISNWRSELNALDEAIANIDSKKRKKLTEKRVVTDNGLKRTLPSTLSLKLEGFTKPDLDFKHQKRSGDSSPVALAPKSLLGFCWLMIAREIENSVSYVRCRGYDIPHVNQHSGLQVPGCGRYVPSLNPKNNPNTVCSKNCSARADRLAKKIAKTRTK